MLRSLFCYLCLCCQLSPLHTHSALSRQQTKPMQRSVTQGSKQQRQHCQHRQQATVQAPVPLRPCIILASSTSSHILLCAGAAKRACEQSAAFEPKAKKVCANIFHAGICCVYRPGQSTSPSTVTGLAWPGLSIWLTWPEAGSGKGRRGAWQLSACYADKILFAITIVAAAAVAAFVGNC